MLMTDAELWARDAADVSQSVNVGPLDDGAQVAHLPGNDAAFWDAVAARVEELRAQHGAS